MSRERRNLYRLLFVQPEAPPEVIKAAWRAMMSTLRGHPDLGGDPEMAARLNAAYEVLSDPQRRQAYDDSLRRPRRQAQTPEPPAPQCPFCDRPLETPPVRDSRCPRCGSPLCPAPASAGQGELLGRRRGERFDRHTAVEVRLRGDRRMRRAQLRDLSFSGLSMLMTEPVDKQQVVRVKAGNFEALVRVVASRSVAGGYSVHTQLLTLWLSPAARGVYVDASA